MPGPASFFVTPIQVTVPNELTSEAELLKFFAVSAAELKKIWWFRSRMYQKFEISKGKGKKRLISAPDHRLKMLQTKIASSLAPIYRPRNPVHGFVDNRSVKTNATAHLRSKFIMNLDIEGFFSAITEGRVSGLMSALGIDGRVAEILARICCNEGVLPQGAPSSPIISNMICFRMDKQLQRIAKESRCIYTRYADDVTFSSYQPLTLLFEGPPPPAGNFSPDLLKDGLRGAFRSNGFAINPQKVHYADKHSRRTVTGLKINEIVNVDRKFVRNIRAALFVVEKQGAAVAQKTLKDKYGREAALASHLRGRISWVGHIKGPSDPIFRSLASRYNKLFPSEKLEILPTIVEIRERAVWVVEHWGGDATEGSVQGTAFFLKSVGLVTAWHCVDGATEIAVYHPSKPSNKFKVTVAKNDAHRDLAVLAHEIPATEYYEFDISKRTFKAGDNTTALGFPGFGPGDKINVRSGLITSLPIKSAVPMIEVAQKLSQGMSGGPLLDEDGAVAGINYKGGPSEARDFAVHVKALTDWLSVA
ncbi:reverse transcriptase domain-containing protein [Bradyrhizobium elkanii]|uniref:reverse transcriptase domain-containing protein n=1 Tax=Bradyrhizobium elkanii TaxID=29448 RepID=UPI00209D5CE2|nr:S1-C subfamily serine protease [Bradyrhizobium elkanii]MCS4106427.1 S1-C subfamily serine protease [Bradyrhizobium elkanii]